MSTRPDARQKPRHAVGVEASVRTGDRTMQAMTRDMSCSGICLLCPAEIPRGSIIALELALVLGDSAASESLVLEGRVIWCTLVGRVYQVGAVFVNVDAQRRAYLDIFLRFLEQEIVLGGSAEESQDAAAGGRRKA